MKPLDRITLTLLLSFLSAVVLAAGGTADVRSSGEVRPLSFLRPTIVPEPVSLAFSETEEVSLKSVRIACAKDEAAIGAWARGKAKDWFGACAELVPASGRLVDGGPEAYEIAADPTNGVLVRANAPEGVRHAFHTLRQCAIPLRGTLKTSGYVLPVLEIRDAPALSFRGIHLCWFPGVGAKHMERLVRLAAFYKFNYAVIEFWGVYRWKKHPGFAWPDAHVSADDVARLVEIGRDLGIVLCPQFNVFGHAAMSRFIGGKHATLDIRPEYAPVFEPMGGWNWCLSNPETRRIQADMIDELCEAFGNPPYFHIGCDEAEEPSCPVCRAGDYAELVGGHIGFVRNHLKSRDIRTMMWHDMLLDGADGRWTGYYARGDARTAELVDMLPRDVVICDWYYGPPRQGFLGRLLGLDIEYPTLAFFLGKGFEVLTCPWQNHDGIPEQAACARRLGLKGLLATTWNRAYGRDFAWAMIYASCGAWGTSHLRYANAFGTLVFASHLRQAGADVPVSSRDESGFVTDDVPQRPYVGVDNN